MKYLHHKAKASTRHIFKEVNIFKFASSTAQHKHIIFFWIIRTRKQKKRNSYKALHLGDLRGVWYCLFWKFEVESQHDNKNQDRNNGANNTLVPVHPFRHVRQNFLALAYVIIHSMKLHKGIQSIRRSNSVWFVFHHYHYRVILSWIFSFSQDKDIIFFWIIRTRKQTKKRNS